MVFIACSDPDEALYLAEPGVNHTDGKDVGISDADVDYEHYCPSEKYEQGLCLPQAPQGTPADECPSGEFRAHLSIEGEGICLPQPPQGTPPDRCPSGEYMSDEAMEGEGVCLPERPRLHDWDCPEGWLIEELPDGIRESAGTFEVCRPPELPTECPEGQWPSLRDAGCVDHGMACPEESAWPTEAALQDEVQGFSGEILYVDGATGQEEATGSRQIPYITISAAISAAQHGDIIAVGRGTYTEPITIDKDIAIIGACVAQTRLEATDDDNHAVGIEAKGLVYLGHLTIKGGDRGVDVLLDNADADVRLHSLAIEQSGALVNAQNTGASVSVRDLVITEGDSDESKGLRFTGNGVGEVDGAWLRTPQNTALEVEFFTLKATDIWSEGAGEQWKAAIELKFSADVELRRIGIANFAEVGLEVKNTGTQADVRDLYLSIEEPDDTFQPYLRVTAKAELSGERIHVDGNNAQQSRMAFWIDEDAKVSARQFVARDLRFNPDIWGVGILVMSEAEANFDEVFYRGGIRGLVVDGTQVVAHNVVITTISNEEEDRLENGVLLIGGNLELHRAEIGGGPVEENGLEVHADGELVGTDIALLWDPSEAANLSLWQGGINSTNGGQMQLERVQIEGAHGAGIFMTNSEASIRDLVIRKTQGIEDVLGIGIEIDRSHLELNHFLIDQALTAGVNFYGTSTNSTIRDGVVREIASASETRQRKVGGLVWAGATLKMKRITFQDIGSRGLVVETESDVTGTDIHIANVNIDPTSSSGGHGLINTNSTIRGRRWWISDAYSYGIFVHQADGVVDLHDVVVEDIKSHPHEEALGLGAMAYRRSHLNLSRALIQNTRHVGIWGFPSAHIELSDTVIANIKGRELDNSFGIGLGVASDSTATLDRVTVDESQLAGLTAMGDSTIDGRDVRVRTTRSAECAGENCQFPGGGIGVSTREWSKSSFDRFVIEDSALAAVQITTNSEVNFINGLIKTNRIGVNLDTTDFDLDQSFSRVYLDDNEQDIVSQELAMPSVQDLAQSFGL